MKFGKHIQKRQLDIPEYGASFVDYKALKKLIKKLSATPVIQPLGDKGNATEPIDPQTALQANKATFFFRLDREIEKVNAFYLLKEAELKLRLTTLMDKKKAMQAHPTTSKLSSRYITLQEGFQQFSSDLNKLQQYVEINGTAFSKILKKWDKTSKSEAKETYLSRAVEVQPCFNRDVISHLSDQATSNVLDFEAWAEGERMQFATSDTQDDAIMVDAEDDYLDSQVLLAVNGGNISVVRDWVARICNVPGAAVRITRAFLGTAAKAPEDVLRVMAETELVDMNYADEINQRNCLHVAAINGRSDLFRLGMAGGANVRAVDAYGRLPLHYASMQGHTDMLPELARAAPDTIDAKDLDGFTPLIHGIAHSCLAAIDLLLSFGARVDPESESDQIPLNLACQHESETVVRLLLARQPRILPDAEGLYPQHLVARFGKRPGVLLLLKNSGADLDQADKLYQWTPLFHAASEGNVECLKILLNSGVSVHVKDEKGLMALYYATWEGHLECIELLSAAAKLQRIATPQAAPSIAGIAPPSRSVGPMAEEPDGIPDLRLPPPIIPFRRYGHNFLDNKTYVIINLGNGGTEAIEFYGENKYPAARLTISSKSSDLIPRNLPLPVQDESKTISFQIDNLESFSIDFDIYPTFGSKVIARTVASSKVFTGMSSSSGNWHLELFDPRLHAIGRVNFDFQVVKPFHGIPLEITQFATYWKATNPVANSDDTAGTLVTGSSLSGSYVRLYVQLTADGVPVLYPRFKIQHQGLEMPVNSLTLSQFREVASQQQTGPNTRPPPKSPEDMPLKILKQLGRDIPAAHRLLASSFATLRDALAALSPSVHVELHVLYPTRDEEVSLRLGATPNINDVVDSMLTVVFEHARNLRGDGSGEGFVRSVVFSSSHADLCTALNWKQPNYPVLLCNDLCFSSNFDDEATVLAVAGGGAMVRAGSVSRPCVSVKEAVRIASNNNFMGLICSSQLLNLAPALKKTIKVAGLVLVEDVSRADGDMTAGNTSADEMAVDSTADSVDGVLHSDGVLVFSETIDM